ncbi:MAG: hypothetical protein FJX23_09775 [Alphaproteobacteria bacterium]|nr:hypothetical protein [Alphaproteobacteria bacterium]
MSQSETDTVKQAPAAVQDAAAQQAEKRVAHIWDDPESRISFLETVMKGKEWEAKVYHPDFTQTPGQNPNIHPLSDLSAKMVEKGYKVALGQDENGIPTLDIKHFGGDTKLLESVKELGFTKGVGHKITHIGEPLGNAMKKSGDLMKYVLTDKARLIGTAYLVGDLFLAAAGSAGHSKDKLKTVAGVGATLQSLVYMAFAKEGSETVYDDLMKTAKEADRDGKSLLDAGTFHNHDDHGPKGLLGVGNKLLKDKPLETGALLQVAGSAALMGAGFRSMKNGGNKVAGISDMATALASAIGWGLVTKHTKPTDPEDKLPWSNPKRVWQEVNAHPTKFASGFMSLATLTGITGGIKGGNKPQVLAYSTYLIGDGLMFATNSEHYGSAGANNPDMLATAAEKFLKASPLVLGAEEQQQFVGRLSDYLSERASAQVAKKEKREVQPGEVENLSKRINANLTAKLQQVSDQTNQVADHIAKVAGLYPEAEGREVAQALSVAVSKLNGVHINPVELYSHVARHEEFVKPEEAKPVTSSRLTKPVQALLDTIPGAAGEAVNGIFDAIGKHVQPDAPKLPKGEQPVVGAHTASLASARQEAERASPQGITH